MTNSNNKDKPFQQPMIAPLSSDLNRSWSYINESHDIRKSYDSGQNTIRNTHPAPDNPNGDKGGSNQDKK